jgi:glycerophosphoryl diester phosphodiesterase
VNRFCLLIIIVALSAQPFSAAQSRVMLTGFAVLPADTFADGPPSGAWLRGDAIGVPQFPSQPVQGVSALWPATASGATEWFALSDNGFGAKLNSSDYLLRIYRLSIDWSTTAAPGRIMTRPFIQIADPDRKLPFPIARETTTERWLTGADLDPESLVRMADGTFWIGDEFGPFLLHLAADGRVLERPFEIPDVRSPDHPHLAPADVGKASPAQVGRSRGFEGLARLGPDLYAALESGLGADSDAATIHEFNIEKRAFTGQSWRYPLAARGHAVTELVPLSHLAPECQARFLVIERDGGHGSAAKFKRVFELHLAGNSSVSRLMVDLLDIDNPKRLGGQPATFTFPFITTEAVWAVSSNEIVVANDNNFPAGGGRPGAVRDATEFIRLALPRPLCGA